MNRQTSIIKHTAIKHTETFRFHVAGMTCASCAGRLQRVLGENPHIMTAQVNFALGTGVVSVAAGTLNLSEVFSVVSDAGFEAAEASESELPDAEKSLHRLHMQVLVSAALTFPLVLPMLLYPFGVDLHLDAVVQFVLATPVQFYIGARFYKGAWVALKHASGTMDLLVALGTSVAYIFSFFAAFRPDVIGTRDLYFETAAVVITLILFGRMLEEKARRGMTEALAALMALAPEEALLLKDGEEILVALDSLQAGDRLVVKPGQTIPADAIILEGAGEVSEAMLTGEPMPVFKQVGDDVTGGTVNITARFILEVTREVSSGRLSRIIELVRNAQAGQAPIQKMVDKVAAIFVPVVLLVAAFTFFLWWGVGGDIEKAMLYAVSVLVIACPCALGLATPTAILAGTGAAARNGILFRDIDALQKMTKVNHLVFDKTGTLTHGRPAIDSVIVFSNKPEKMLLEYAASVQKDSEHPMARAFLAADRNLHLKTAQNVKAIPGRGIAAVVDGKDILLGNAQLMRDAGISVPENSGATHVGSYVFLAIQGSCEALFILKDSIRKEAPKAIQMLKQAGIKMDLVSGDHINVARYVGDSLGLSHIYGGISPEGKLDYIAQHKSEDGFISMVGDGINDAPALAKADVGIAMGQGTDIAKQAAAVTLLRPDLCLIYRARILSEATMRTIRQNLFWAFFFNAVGIPLAAMGYLSPMVAGAAMSMSSLLVVSNAWLLSRFKTTDWEIKQQVGP